MLISTSDIYLLSHIKSLLLYGGKLPPVAGERGKNSIASLRVKCGVHVLLATRALTRYIAIGYASIPCSAVPSRGF